MDVKNVETIYCHIQWLFVYRDNKTNNKLYTYLQIMYEKRAVTSLHEPCNNSSCVHAKEAKPISSWLLLKQGVGCTLLTTFSCYGSYLLFPVRCKNSFGLVVSCKTMNSTFNKNEPELCIFILKQEHQDNLSQLTIIL